MYLQKHGAIAEITDDPDRAEFRDQMGIPQSVASCHTAMVDGYAIEGHVPVEAIARLLEQRPDATGLALAGMPSDSPGMGGGEISWANQPVMLVGADGTLSAFDY